MRFNLIESDRGPFAIRVELIRDVECRRCGGIGHIQRHCQTTIKSKSGNPRCFFTNLYGSIKWYENGHIFVP